MHLSKQLFSIAAGLLVFQLQPVASELMGEEVYNKWCNGCHMDSPFAPGTIQLRQSRGDELALITQRDDLTGAYVKQLVRKGLNGMPLFRRTEISNKELEALTDFLVNK